MYETVRNYRKNQDYKIDSLKRILKEVTSNYPSEWLLLLELYELVYNKDLSLMNAIYDELLKLKQNKHFTKLITDGLELIINK